MGLLSFDISGGSVSGASETCYRKRRVSHSAGNRVPLSRNEDWFGIEIKRDYNTFSGLMLERYFHRVAMESGQFTRIGRWWDSKGENEIDMIDEDELADSAVFYEIKRQKDDVSMGGLETKD